VRIPNQWGLGDACGVDASRRLVAAISGSRLGEQPPPREGVRFVAPEKDVPLLLRALAASPWGRWPAVAARQLRPYIEARERTVLSLGIQRRVRRGSGRWWGGGCGRSSLQLMLEAGPEPWLDAGATTRLRGHVEAARERTRATGRSVLASVTVPLGQPADPAATILASRQEHEPWFCLEQPEREGWALAGLGCAQALQASGPERFAVVERAWRRAGALACSDAPGGPPGIGLVAMGGFAFNPAGTGSPPWSGFCPASLIVPVVALARHRERTWVTLTVAVQPDDTTADAVGRAEDTLSRLREAPLPLLDPAPAAAPQVRSVMPPSHYEEAVAGAVQRIRHGELEKVVLAREVEVSAPAGLDPGAIFGVLRQGFPSCFIYAVGRRDSTFTGATPELLIRRQGARASTVALAGSTRRSADPAVDAHLGERLLGSTKDREENAIVARRIARALRPYSVWVAAAPDPVVVKVANIQHLAAPIRAQLTGPVGAVELAGSLHPTPAVGGEPWSVAEPLIPALEGFDRGWYAGPVGWTDASGDGEFCVALRCGLLRGTSARLFAGAGIVRDSEPAAELAETEVKLQALLPLVAS